MFSLWTVVPTLATFVFLALAGVKIVKTRRSSRRAAELDREGICHECEGRGEMDYGFGESVACNGCKGTGESAALASSQSPIAQTSIVSEASDERHANTIPSRSA